MYAEETQYPRWEQPTAEYLLFIRDVFHYISDLTAKNPAEGVDGVGTDAFVTLEPEYLHILAQKDRSELSVYLGNYISFVLPLDSVLYNAELEGFGEMESVMIFSPGDGKSFIVDSSEVDVEKYKSGDMFYIRAKLTAAAPDKVYILNAYGCPGWPNDITIKTMSQN